MVLRIVTNHHFRPIMSGSQLPPSILAEFDYLSQDEFLEHSFVEYRGNWYDLSEFTQIAADSPFANWDGVAVDFWFSGVLIKLSPCGDFAKLARYFEEKGTPS